MHGPVARSAIGVLFINLLIDRSRTVSSTCALVQDRRAAVPVRLVACIAVNVAGGNPALAADCLDAKAHVHIVDALEGQRLGLKDEKVDYGRGDKVAAEEDEAESVADTVVGIRCQKTDQKVAQPIERGRERSLLSTGTEWECLANDDPDERTPGRRERRDEHTGAHDHDDARRRVLCRWTNNANDGKDEQPSGLPETTEDQRHATAETLDHPETRDGHGDVDSAENQLCLDGVLDTSGVKDCSAVVEEIVDASPCDILAMFVRQEI